jgi:hypothetical protein
VDTSFLRPAKPEQVLERAPSGEAWVARLDDGRQALVVPLANPFRLLAKLGSRRFPRSVGYQGWR